MNPSHGPIRWAVVSHNGLLYWLVESYRRSPFRSSFNDRSNGPLLTTTTRTDGTMTSPVSKRQQEAAAQKEISKRRKLRDMLELDSSSGLESDEGSAEADSDGENPPADTLGKCNNDAEKSGEDDTNAEESGDKDSVAEESNK
ncbi:hypothetical protein HAX54_022312 [Datura stramonium]|uniref:Uncharacterized protein n=1 Tax=Datura stramonium TaxID=4076 RepID=A0ABS8UUB4_DATST|nr:hypothetical protein [Datura stramonium]